MVVINHAAHNIQISGIRKTEDAVLAAKSRSSSIKEPRRLLAFATGAVFKWALDWLYFVKAIE